MIRIMARFAKRVVVARFVRMIRAGVPLMRMSTASKGLCAPRMVVASARATPARRAVKMGIARAFPAKRSAPRPARNVVI